MKCVCTAKERGRDMERVRQSERKRRAIEWNDFLMRCHCWCGRHKVLTENTYAKLIEINTKAHTYPHTPCVSDAQYQMLAFDDIQSRSPKYLSSHTIYTIPIFSSLPSAESTQLSMWNERLRLVSILPFIFPFSKLSMPISIVGH